MEFQFSRYETEEQRGIADEQLRAFVGERLVELPSVELENLTGDVRAVYDHVLLRCEFANEEVIKKFGHFATPRAIEQTQAVDREIIAAASDLGNNSAPLDETLRRLEEAFEKRDKAMLDL